MKLLSCRRDASPRESQRSGRNQNNALESLHLEVQWSCRAARTSGMPRPGGRPPHLRRPACGARPASAEGAPAASVGQQRPKKKLGRMRPKKKLGRVRPKKKLGRIGQLWELWQPLCQLPVVCQLQQFAGCTSSSVAGGLPSSASLCSQPRRASGCGCGGVLSARALSA